MRSAHSYTSRIILVFLTLIGASVIYYLSLQPDEYVAVAVAKGGFIDVPTIGLAPHEQNAIDIVMANDTLAELLDGDRSQFIAADELGVSELPAGAPLACYQQGCLHVSYYNLDRGETVEAVVNPHEQNVVAYWQNENSRPRATHHLLPRVLRIASGNKEVIDLIGDPTQLDMVMVPMSTWLSDDDCGQAWCIDLTFPSPHNDGRILHVTVNVEQERVARIFYTRGREARQSNTPEPEERANRYTNGCHEEFGWQVCWEMTAHDGLNFYDVTFDDQLILTSSKIAQVEVYYAAWPGGYRDEIGFNASVLPKFDTRISSFADDSFEVRQMFTEEFNWPNCVCCYRYDQIMRFYADGTFDHRFVSYGPGCDDLSSYRPFWRIDHALDDDANNNVYTWNEAEADWALVEAEAGIALFGATSPDGANVAVESDTLLYSFIPEPTDPVGLDEGRLFFVQHREEEGVGPIEAGPADTFIPPLQWIDEEAVSGANGVLWYVPFLKTKRAEPWFCMPDPEPDFSPCEAILAARPLNSLAQPDPEPTEAPAPDELEPTAAPTLAPTPTPRPVAGVTPEEIIINSGCGACHVIGPLGEAGKVGPNLSNIGVEASERIPGVTAEDYLRQSLLEPNAFIVPDCPNDPCPAGAMPDYSTRLTEAQVNTLVTYMLTLGVEEVEAAVTPLAETITPAETPAIIEKASQVATENASLILPMVAGIGLIVVTISLIVWRRHIVNGDE